MIKNNLNILLIFFLYIFNCSLCQAETKYDSVEFLIRDDKDFTRLIISSPNSVNFVSKIDDNILSIKFNKKISIKAEQLRYTSKIIKNIILKNNSEIYITLDDSNYKIRRFVSEQFSGIDLVILHDKKNTANKNIQKSEDKAIKIKNSTDQPSNMLVSKVEADLEKIPRIDKSKLHYQEDSNGRKIIFPWQENVAASVFYRANYLWIVFSKKENFDFTEIRKYFPEFHEINQLDNDEYSIIKITTDAIVDVSAYKNNRDWVITIPKDLNLANNFITEYNTIYSQGIFFPAKNLNDRALIINDPVFGDQLIVVLFYESNWLVDKMKHYIDFILLPSVQGFVINPLSKDIRVNIIVPGIEVITTQKTEQNLDPIQYSILPYDTSRQQSNFVLTKIKLNHNIINADKSDINKLRLELAKFYLSNSLNYEAYGILDLIIKNDLIFSENKEYLLLRAVSSFLINKNKEAKEIFTKLEKESFIDQDRAEINFWQKANELKLGNKNNFDYLKYRNKFLSIYPQNIKANLIFMDLENSINNENTEHLRDLVETLSQENLSSDSEDIFNYYKGIYLEKKGSFDEAIDIWQNIANNLNNRQARAMAKFAITKNLYQNGKIDINKAIDNLNNIRHIWRGDKVELNLLKYLANLYYLNKDYIETLRLWKIIANNFSNTHNSLFITVEMSKLFNDIFAGAYMNQISDFQAVSLYYEFRELTPIGKIGDKIISNLIIKLIKLDLLDKAEELLEHQINYRVSKEDKAKEINNLAFVYLIHNKPAKLLELYSNDFQANTEELFKAKLLKAKSYVDLKKYDEALSLIEGENLEDIEDLLIEIYLKSERWDNAINLLELILIKLQNKAQSLSDRDKNNIMNLAVLYKITNDKNSLVQLYNNFENRLNNDSLNNTLLTFSKNQLDDNYNNIQLSLDNKNSFLYSYKQKYFH